MPIVCGDPVGLPYVEIEDLDDLTICHVGGCISLRTNEWLERPIKTAAKPMMLIIDSTGGYVEHAWEIRENMLAARARGVRIAVFAKRRLHGAALLLALGTPFRFADPLATIGDVSISIRSGDCDSDVDLPYAIANHMVYFSGGRFSVGATWFPTYLSSSFNIEALSAGMVVNAEFAELCNLTLPSTLDSAIDTFRRVIQSLDASSKE